MIISPQMSAFRGFTLIELLVVISIIALLSSVALASLSAARNKAADASIKANLSGARAESEIFFSIGQTYDLACAATGTNVIGDSVTAADIAYDGSAAAYTDAGVPSTSAGACHDSQNAWVAEVPLKTSAGATFFCVDSTGKAITTGTAIIANAMACP